MISSNSRKLCLSGWLKENNEAEYNTPLKLQKFLLFYEVFSKVAGEEPDFSHLRGYARGPVFSNVWGDYTKERESFNSAATKAYNKEQENINIARAKKCAFIVGSMTEQELSDLTHCLNLWKAKEDKIKRGLYQVNLSENDFNSNDENMIKLLDSMYSEEMINNSVIIQLYGNYFVFNKNDIPKLTEIHFDTLSTLTEQAELHNPVYVDIDEEGRLLVD